jgi:hypothetical protein
MQIKPIYKGEDWTGKKIGSLVVVGYGEPYVYYTGSKKNTIHKWKVKCDCGNEYLISKQHITSGEQSNCQKCYGQRLMLSNSPLWKSSAKFLPGMKFHKIQKSAEKRGLEFKVTREHLDEIFQKQNGKCVYLGEELSFGNGRKGTASLDRIDSTKGYIEGNVQWVHKDVNILKWTLSHERFIEMCKKVAQRF